MESKMTNKISTNISINDALSMELLYDIPFKFVHHYLEQNEEEKDEKNILMFMERLSPIEVYGKPYDRVMIRLILYKWDVDRCTYGGTAKFDVVKEYRRGSIDTHMKDWVDKLFSKEKSVKELQDEIEENKEKIKELEKKKRDLQNK